MERGEKMGRFKNFCIFAAAVGMLFGGVGLAALCLRKPETAVILGGVLLAFGAAAFLAHKALFLLAPQYIAGRRLDKSIRNGGMAWLAAYEGNEDLWLETQEDTEEETDGLPVFVKLERREGLERLFFSADGKRLREAGLETGMPLWACVMVPGSFQRVLLLGTLEEAKDGVACIAVREGKASGENGRSHKNFYLR